MPKTVAEQFAREVKEVSDNLKAPVCNLVGNSVEASLEVLGAVTSGVGQVLGALIDEASRVGKRIRREIHAASQ